MANLPYQIISDADAKDIVQGTYSPQLLSRVVVQFQQHSTLHLAYAEGKDPSLSDENGLLSVKFDPRVECGCNGLDPTEDKIQLGKARQFAGSKCKAIEAMWQRVDTVIERSNDWNGHGIFTEQTLREAAQELTLINTNIQPPTRTCYSRTVDFIKAPDRRRNDEVDSAYDLYCKAFPTFENLKMAADAKYFIAIACGVSKCDEGLARAVADATNDVLIGDYCEAADARTLNILQETGAAAFAFLRLCQMAGAIDEWHIDILAAGSIHFRALSYYRDHTKSTLSNKLHGSSMTNLEAQRYVDLGISSPIVIASLATGQRLDGAQYRKLVKASVLLNDLIDFRSDAMRMQRENIVLRGVRGNVCKFLSRTMVECIEAVTMVIKLGTLPALVILGFCNWLLMASHHKIFEIVSGVEKVNGFALCDYRGMEEYANLLVVLESFGEVQESIPTVIMTRAELESGYCKSRLSFETHVAWLAGSARTILHPHNLRRIIDVAHYIWSGSVGDKEFCP